MEAVTLAGTTSDGATISVDVAFTPNPLALGLGPELFDAGSLVAYGTGHITGTDLHISETSGIGGGAEYTAFACDEGQAYFVRLPITSISGDTFGAAVFIGGNRIPYSGPFYNSAGEHSGIIIAGGDEDGLNIALQGDEITAVVDLSAFSVRAIL